MPRSKTVWSKLSCMIQPFKLDDEKYSPIILLYQWKNIHKKQNDHLYAPAATQKDVTTKHFTYDQHVQSVADGVSCHVKISLHQSEICWSKNQGQLAYYHNVLLLLQLLPAISQTWVHSSSCRKNVRVHSVWENKPLNLREILTHF